MHENNLERLRTPALRQKRNTSPTRWGDLAKGDQAFEDLLCTYSPASLVLQAAFSIYHGELAKEKGQTRPSARSIFRTPYIPGKVMMELPALSERVVDLRSRRKDDCVDRCTKMSLAKTAFHPTIGSHSSSAFIRYCQKNKTAARFDPRWCIQHGEKREGEATRRKAKKYTYIKRRYEQTSDRLIEGRPIDRAERVCCRYVFASPPSRRLHLRRQPGRETSRRDTGLNSRFAQFRHVAKNEVLSLVGGKVSQRFDTQAHSAAAA